MSRPATPDGDDLHASTAVIGEAGVLVRGPSGSGKTRLALALVETHAARGRFARLVADDRTLVAAHGDRLVARPHPALAGWVERRGLGILPVVHAPACVLGLAVDLVAGTVPRLPSPRDGEATILGVRLPRLALPAGIAAPDAVSLVLTRLAMLPPHPQALAPFSLPRPPRCTR